MRGALIGGGLAVFSAIGNTSKNRADMWTFSSKKRPICKGFQPRFLRGKYDYMSCTDIAKYFPHFPICRGTVLAVPRRFCFGTFCPKVKARRVSTGPQPTGFGEAPQQAFLPHDGAKISSVFTLELLAKNASVATLALLAD